MLTKDENIVDVTVSAQYRIANLKDFVLNVKDPEVSLRQGIESALRHVVGDNTLEQTLTVGRENIASEVQGRLQQILDSYATGLIVQQVNIEKTDPPAAVKDAFDDVVAAREDKERLQNEAERYALSIVPEARGQAQARIREAEGYKLEVVANAEGEVGRFIQLYANNPPPKWNKCIRVKTYKNEPEALLPGPVKYTPLVYNTFQVIY